MAAILRSDVANLYIELTTTEIENILFKKQIRICSFDTDAPASS
jgi:hypothetical protein